MSACISRKPHRPIANIHQISRVYVDCGICCGFGLDLLCQHCSAFYYSGFVDDVMFSRNSHNEPYGASCVLIRDESVTMEATASISTEFRSAIKISK